VGGDKHPERHIPTPRKPGITRASGAQTLLTEEELDANAAAIDKVVQAFGGKAGLMETLGVASDVPEVEELLRLLIDPRYETISLRRLCAMAGLTIVDLFTAYKKAMVVKAHLVAYQTITDKLLPVVEDVMRRAAPYEIVCYGCAGTETVADPTDATKTVVCPDCGGKGKLLQLPDLDRQKLALELAQLVQKSSGIQIQQNNVVPPPTADPPAGHGTLIALQHALRELQSGPRTPIVDAEVVPPAEGS
jgi:hypothetical protein